MRAADGVLERGLLFSGEMVRALLARRKTQTRRVVAATGVQSFELGMEVPEFRAALPARCRYGKPGERVWVRETFTYAEAEIAPGRRAVIYRAGSVLESDRTVRWLPSIHMPRHASRILLELTDIRVERVQAITEADAEAEGMALYREPLGTLRATFQSRWDALNGKRGHGWNANPWVWALSFRVLEVKP